MCVWIRLFSSYEMLAALASTRLQGVAFPKRSACFSSIGGAAAVFHFIVNLLAFWEEPGFCDWCQTCECNETLLEEGEAIEWKAVLFAEVYFTL